MIGPANDENRSIETPYDARKKPQISNSCGPSSPATSRRISPGGGLRVKLSMTLQGAVGFEGGGTSIEKGVFLGRITSVWGLSSIGGWSATSIRPVPARL